MPKIAPINFHERDAFGIIPTPRPRSSRLTSVVVLPLTNCVDLVRDAQLSEDAAHHVMHGRLTDPRPVRDCFVGMSFGHVLHQTVFASRKRPAAMPSMACTLSAWLRFRNLGLRTRDAERQRGQEMGGRKRLWQESPRAALPRQVNCPRIVKPGDHHNDEVREQRLKASGAFDARHAGHFDVHQYNLRAGVGNSDEGSFAAGIRTDAPELARVIDDFPQENLEVLVVIHNRHANLTERQGDWL